MYVDDLRRMIGGWFVGDFEPSAYRTGMFEVAVKEYAAGDSEKCHIHRVATELTVIVRGRVRMKGSDYGAGAIVVIEPDDPTDFVALEDTITVVVKTPSVHGDKYVVEPH